MSPTAIAAAKASALRIDSAYAAAECMKASLRADVDNLTEEESNKSATTMAMLDVMMKSLEKSKVSLNDILHSPEKEKESVVSDDSGRERRVHSDNRKHTRRRSKDKRSSKSPDTDSYQSDDVDESNSDDRSGSYTYNTTRHQEQEQEPSHHKHHHQDIESSGSHWDGRSSTGGKKKPTTRNGYASHTPEMQMLRTNELNSSSSGGLEDRWDDDTQDQTPFGRYSTSKRGYYDSSPTRVYKSSLLESSGADSNTNTATNADFRELQRFEKSTGGCTDENHCEQDPLNNTTSSGNRNMAAAVVARYKQGKAGQPAQNLVPRVWRICLSQGPLLKVSLVFFAQINLFV